MTIDLEIVDSIILNVDTGFFIFYAFLPWKYGIIFSPKIFIAFITWGKNETVVHDAAINPITVIASMRGCIAYLSYKVSLIASHIPACYMTSPKAKQGHEVFVELQAH